MAKLQDKFFNRVIEGKLELNAEELVEQVNNVVNSHKVCNVYNVDDILSLNDELIDKIKCGDIIRLSSPSDEEYYTCSYKDFGDGIIRFIQLTPQYIYYFEYVWEDDAWQPPEDISEIEIPSKVVANPTLAGTESALTGLQVGDTKYKVSGGTKLYKHTINITCVDDYGDPANSWTLECIHYLGDRFNATSDDYVKLSKALSMTFNFNSPCFILGNGKFVYLDDDQITFAYEFINTLNDVVTPL